MKGSSSSSSRGSWMKAEASIIFCRCPLDRSLQRTSLLSSTSKNASHLSTLSLMPSSPLILHVSSRSSWAVMKEGGVSASGTMPTARLTPMASWEETPAVVAEPASGSI
ncbi:hypothetical protein ES703_09565 [subsurface metagenome]